MSSWHYADVSHRLQRERRVSGQFSRDFSDDKVLVLSSSVPSSRTLLICGVLSPLTQSPNFGLGEFHLATFNPEKTLRDEFKSVMIAYALVETHGGNSLNPSEFPSFIGEQIIRKIAISPRLIEIGRTSVCLHVLAKAISEQ